MILDNANWCSQELARSPAGPTEEIDVPGLIKDRLGGSENLKQDFEVELPDTPVIVRTHRLYLGQALQALFRGVKTAFGVRRIRLLALPSEQRPSHYILRFMLEPPVPAGFDDAKRLVSLDSVADDARLLQCFKKGYTGDFTLLDFLVGVALWGDLAFDTQGGSVSITLPNLEKKEQKYEQSR